MRVTMRLAARLHVVFVFDSGLDTRVNENGFKFKLIFLVIRFFSCLMVGLAHENVPNVASFSQMTIVMDII